MARIRSIFVLAAAAVLGGALFATYSAHIASPPSARAADDKDAKKAEKLKAKRDAFRTKLKEAGKFPFFDMSYAADQKAVQETRWTQTDPPPFADVSEEKGGQFWAVWSPDITKGWGVEIRVIKYIHKSLDGKSEFSMNFEHAGKTCKTADKKAMIEGFYEDWLKQARDVVESKCVEPKKKKVGPTEMWASIVGTDPEAGKRERRDFYLWTDANTTWIAVVRFNDKYLDDPGILEKAEEFIGTIRDLKPPTK